MSIQNLSTVAVDRNTSPPASVIRQSESVDSLKIGNDISAKSQAVTEDVQNEKSRSQDNAKVLSLDADKQSQATTESKVGVKAEAQEGESLKQGLQQVADSTSQLSPLQMRKLEFSTTQESGRTVVKVIDKENNDVIRQIPSEEFIRVAQKISDLSQEMDAAQGLLFDSKV